MTKRKGFTLVELLIVVVIIGVLTSMMSISSTSAVDSAKASAIIGNLSTMKKAALALYIESEDVANGDTAKLLEAVADYMGTTGDIMKDETSYDVEVNGTEWYVYYHIQSNGKDTINKNVKSILSSKAKKLGLLGAAENAHFNSSNYFTSQACIGMKVR